MTKYRVTLHHKENNVTTALSTQFVDNTVMTYCALPEAGTNYYLSVAPCRECSGNDCICGAESFSGPFYTSKNDAYEILFSYNFLLCVFHVFAM